MNKAPKPFDHDAYLRQHCPSHAERALALRDRIQALGCQCATSPEFDDNDPLDEAALTIWHHGSVLGCATIDAQGISYYLEGAGSSDIATDEQLLDAVLIAITPKEA